MKRLCLTIVGVVCVTAGTAKAESLSAKPARPHLARTATFEAAAAKSGSLGGISFSDPYAPPVGVRKTKIARFPTIQTDAPVEPKGGLSLFAGRDNPDAPFTGELKFRY